MQEFDMKKYTKIFLGEMPTSSGMDGVRLPCWLQAGAFSGKMPNFFGKMLTIFGLGLFNFAEKLI
jgi:hypothetical protein